VQPGHCWPWHCALWKARLLAGADQDLKKFLSFYGRFKRHLHTVEVVSGALVIVVGVLILTNSMTRLNGYLSFLNRFAL
jgi:hypothetical protein